VGGCRGYRPDAAKVQITIVLMPKRAALAAQADAVNDPASPRFHHFLTFAEMKAQFMPSDADVASVETWARNGGLSEVNRWSTNHAIVLAGSAAQVNALLGVKLGQYRLRGATYFANDRAPTVAASVAPTIADILGLNSLDRFQPASVGPQSVRDATDLPHVATGAFVTTETLRIDANPKAPHGRMAAGVKPRISGPVGFGIEPEDIWSEQAYDYQGLAKFSHCCNPNNLATGSPVETSIAVIGAHKPDPKDLTGFFKTTYNLAANISLVSIGSPKCCDDEMTLDTEWSGATSNSMGTSNNTAHIYIYAAGSLSNGDLLNAWEAALSGNATRIATTSFSNIEPAFGGIGNSSISDYTDVTRAMTAMGWTLIAAAGDAGADGYTDSSSQSCLRGAVLYPPTDPNVLAAGGTSLTLNTPLAYGSETAWCGNGCGSNTACSGGLTKAKTDGGGGGGGCSDTFPATAWNPGGCAGKHRAIPDLSLNANAGQIIYYSYGPSSFCTGSLCTYDGTSIVAPELAGFFAQENAYLMTLGNNCGPSHDAACAPLGRAADAVYAAVHAPHNPYYDIVSGNTSNGLSKGYNAVAGYDLATGLGSANMMQLAWAINNYLMSAGSTPPLISFGGAQLNTLYSGPVTVTFAINAANRGVAGFTAALDSDPMDTKTEPTPGAGNPFWDGPKILGARSGVVPIAFVPGCHTVYVRAWDNLGAGNTVASYGPICMGTNMQCSFSESACPAGGGTQSYTVSCPQTVNFSVDGQFQTEATSYTGQEAAGRQYTYVKACLPGTVNCQGFNTSSTQTCPINPVQPPTPPITNCKACYETGRQCVKVAGGYQCVGNAQ
jgi:subtilase family serine protease